MRNLCKLYIDAMTVGLGDMSQLIVLLICYVILQNNDGGSLYKSGSICRIESRVNQFFMMDAWTLAQLLLSKNRN